MKIYECENYDFFVFIVALAALSVAAVVRVLLRSRDKMLLCSVLLLGGVALICFGGEAVLARFDMGWRCAPFNTMLVLCVALFVVMLCRCTIVLLKDADSSLRVLGFCSLALVVVITLGCTFLYFNFESWHDHLAPHNGQMIVCADNQHGGSCARCYFVHINDLVHGAEIEPDGYWGYTPPLWS